MDTLIVIAWDETKRLRTLRERGLDFADAGKVFAGRHFTKRAERQNFDEARFITGGWLNGRFVVIVWTERGETFRIISTRHGHGEEEAHFKKELGRSR